MIIREICIFRIVFLAAACGEMHAGYTRDGARKGPVEELSPKDGVAARATPTMSN